MATRRGILRASVLLGGAWVVMARPWNWVLSPALETVPLDGLAPFRTLAEGQQVSVGGASDPLLLGLDTPERTDPALDARLRRDLMQVLNGDWTPGDAGPVPVTYFTDIRCPICRVLERRLALLDGIDLTTREYPIFGPISELAARAVLAAAAQGQGEALRTRLHRVPATITRATLEAAISDLPLDPGQFFAAIEGPEVAARLAEDRALARIFQLPGTPALIVGRTLVVGAAPLRKLEELVVHERTA